MRPLIVNLYYKTPSPGVGTYDTCHPDEIHRIASNLKKLSYKATFESKQKRFHDFAEGDKELRLANINNDFYNVQEALAA